MKLAAEKDPSGNPWYLSAGAGMTATLQLADQKSAYTLTDIASFLTNTANGNIHLVEYVGPGKDMLNVYSVIVINPSWKNYRGTFTAATDFEKYLLSTEGQNLFGSFGVAGPDSLQAVDTAEDRVARIRRRSSGSRATPTSTAQSALRSTASRPADLYK